MILRTRPNHSIVKDAKCALFPKNKDASVFNFYVLSVYFTGLVCNLFVSSLIVAGPMGQPILSSLDLGMSSLLVP